MFIFIGAAQHHVVDAKKQQGGAHQVSHHELGHHNKGVVTKHADEYGGKQAEEGYQKKVYGHDAKYHKDHDVGQGAAYGGHYGGGHQGGYGGIRSGGGHHGYYVQQPPPYYGYYN